MYLSPIVLRSSARVRQTRGGVLIVALLLTAAATLGFTAWANLISQRRVSIEETVGGLSRRLSIENGRQAAIQLGYNELLTKNSGAGVDAKVEDATSLQIYGGVTTTAWAGFALDSINPGKVNHFSPAGVSFAYGPEFSHIVPFSVMDFYPALSWRDNSSTSLVTAIRSRVPMLSGDLLNVFTPTLAVDEPLASQTITGNLDVLNGRAVFLSEAPLGNFSAVRAAGIATPHYTVPVTNPVIFREPSGNTLVMPSNFPSNLVTTGSVAPGNGLDVQNHLNVVDSALNPANSLRNKIINGLVYVTVDTAQDRPDSQGIGYVASTGVLTLDLTDPSLWGVIVQNNVSEIVINGQAVDDQDQASVRICYIEDGNLSTTHTLTKITCNGADNLRPMVIGVKKIPSTAGSQVPGAPVTMAFTNSNVAPEWRCMLIMENTPLVFDATGGPGVIKLMGGIMTDGSITATSGAGNSVRLLPETDHTHLIQLVPRRAWIETYLSYTDGSL